MTPIGYIYLTTCLANGKIYVGRHELNGDKKYIGSGELFKRAVKKYGKENFKRKILRLCYSLHELKVREKIRKAAKKRLSDPRNNPMYGYKFSDEQKKRMSEVQSREKSWMFGRKGKLCHNFGRKLSKETRKKISEKLSGKNNPNYGKRWSDEIRYKISLHHADFSGDKNPMFGKRGVDSPMYNRKWINDGKKEKFVKICGDILPQGYSLGRLKR